MATNPMKRREHTALIIGFIIGLALTIVVGAIGYKKYTDKNKELSALKAQQTSVLVAARNIESGESLTEEDFTLESVITTMSPDDTYVDSSDVLGSLVEWEDEDGNIIEEEQSEAIAKVAIPAGAIITKSMISSNDDVLTNDKRIQEYSSIALPSELKEGDYVDIRFALPTGQDYIVLSKKQVIQTNESTIWINVDESEILLLNSAMVEAWTITGTKLYAIEYVDAGMQDAAQITYKPSAEVTDLINSNPNVTREAMNALTSDLKSLGNSQIVNEFRDYIDSALSEYIEDRDSAVESGYSSEITSMQEHRAEYIQELGQ